MKPGPTRSELLGCHRIYINSGIVNAHGLAAVPVAAHCVTLLLHGVCPGVSLDNAPIPERHARRLRRTGPNHGARTNPRAGDPFSFFVATLADVDHSAAVDVAIPQNEDLANKVRGALQRVPGG